MKRMIKKPDSNMDAAADCAADVYDVMMNYLKSEGFSEQEALDTFEVELESVNASKKKIILHAEISYESFMEVAPKLNEAVQAADADAYFDAMQPGIYECVLNFDKAEKQNQNPIFNDSNIKPVVEKVLKKVSNKLGEDFELTDMYYNAEGYKAPNEADDNDDLVRLYVEAESKSYDTMCYVDMYKSDTISVAQMKADLAAELYSKLINAIAAK